LTTQQSQEEKNGKILAFGDLLVDFLEILTASVDLYGVLLPTLPLGLLA